jgi:hypothetical protein
MIESPTKELLLERVGKQQYHFLCAEDKPNVKTGAKTFLAFRNHNDFLTHLLSTPIRHFYEIIQGDCNALWYLDIDSKCTVDPEGMISSLEFYVKNFFTELNLDDCEISTLCVSDDTKTSYHLIFRSHWITKDKSVRQHLHSLLVAWIKNNHPDFDTDVIDGKVYSSWQNFRTIYSTKIGTDRPLLPTKNITDSTHINHFVTWIDDKINHKIIELKDLPVVETSLLNRFWI